ncbi:MerR family transcriptional regulator [Polystyrenella longa]|uniref:helix-turn-helix domain-containing protein n=1 Tax=Polystyrenella longa TaxID=2528007 RepID=UPI0011A812CD|nr:helix-turn-helix domain-containing protein [Polystyrenella longa]
MTASKIQREVMTPPQLAQRWGVKPFKVLGWIRSGELPAMDISTNRGVGRPRFKVLMTDVLAFEQRRKVQTPIKPQRRVRRSDPNVIEFF